MKTMTSRKLAIEILAEAGDELRVNPLLASHLTTTGSSLSERDRAFVTELVQGATRMRRAVDHVLQPHLRRKLDSDVRAALRIGAYQATFLGTPAHAVVNDTVEAAPRRSKSLVNAVLRRVVEEKPDWPDEATELSYPNWIWDLFQKTWGREGSSALIAMNTPERPAPRTDGYIQGRASRWVADAVNDPRFSGGVLVDLCAAPGGKTTASDSKWTTVCANEINPSRALTLKSTIDRYSPSTNVIISDGRRSPFRSGSVDGVLVDAPCSGLGALGRRSDARWQIDGGAVSRLVNVQKALLSEAHRLLRTGGVLTYSVCTVTHEETVAVAEHFSEHHDDMESVTVSGDYWRQHGRGVIVLPQDYGTDGMAVFQWLKG